jgi:hypothetical protein
MTARHPIPKLPRTLESNIVELVHVRRDAIRMGEYDLAQEGGMQLLLVLDVVAKKSHDVVDSRKVAAARWLVRWFPETDWPVLCAKELGQAGKTRECSRMLHLAQARALRAGDHNSLRKIVGLSVGLELVSPAVEQIAAKESTSPEEALRLVWSWRRFARLVGDWSEHQAVTMLGVGIAKRADLQLERRRLARKAVEETPTCGNYIELADAEEHAGRLVAARNALRNAIALAYRGGMRPQVKALRTRLKALKGDVPRA